jgi:hypothetical protein
MLSEGRGNPGLLSEHWPSGLGARAVECALTCVAFWIWHHVQEVSCGSRWEASMTCWDKNQGSLFIYWAVHSSETSVHAGSTRCHIPEDGILLNIFMSILKLFPLTLISKDQFLWHIFVVHVTNAESSISFWDGKIIVHVWPFFAYLFINCVDVTVSQYLCVKIMYSLLNLFQKYNKKFKFLIPVRKNLLLKQEQFFSATTFSCSLVSLFVVKLQSTENSWCPVCRLVYFHSLN